MTLFSMNAVSEEPKLHVRGARGRQQRPEEMSEVLRGVREADHRAVVVAFFCTWRRGCEQISEDCGLQGEKTAVNTKRCLPSN